MFSYRAIQEYHLATKELITTKSAPSKGISYGQNIRQINNKYFISVDTI